MALRLGQPFQCNRARPKHLYSRARYRSIFCDDYDLGMYLGALEFCKTLEHEMIEQRLTFEPYEPRSFATMYRFLYAHVYALLQCGRVARTDLEISSLAKSGVDPTVLRSVHDRIVHARGQFALHGRSIRRLHRSKEFQDYVSGLTLEIFRRD
jgi:hypothetical protein